MIRLKRFLGLPLSDVELVAWRERRAKGRLYAYLATDLAMTQLYDGQFIIVDPLDQQVSSQIIARGYWEPWVEAAVLRMLKKGDRVVEVGANVGYYTLLMARRIGPRGRLTSFEANPFLALLVARSINLNHLNDRVDLKQMAASNAAGPMTFRWSRLQSGGGHLKVGDSGVGFGEMDQEVQGARLDDIVTGPVQLMRLDAEGSEPLILEGAMELIRQSPDLRICMEWDRVQMSARAEVSEVIDRLAGEGFHFWKIGYDAGLTSLSRADLLALPHSDIVAARRQPF